MVTQDKLKTKVALQHALTLALFGTKLERTKALTEIASFLREQTIGEQEFADLVWWPSLSSEVEEYPMPKEGWTCFHCGEKFTNTAKALLHFGKSPKMDAACIVKHEELGLLAALRKAEEERNAAFHILESLQTLSLNELSSEVARLLKKVPQPHEKDPQSQLG